MNSEYLKTVPEGESNNSNSENFLCITIPQKWWFTQNSLGSFENYYPAILKMFPHEKREQVFSNSGWEIKRGDYRSEMNIPKKILNQRTRKRNELAFLFCSILISSIIVLVISDYLSRHI